MDEDEIKALEARLAELKAARDAASAPPEHSPSHPPPGSPRSGSSSSNKVWLVGGALGCLFLVTLIITNGFSGPSSPVSGAPTQTESGDVEVIAPEPAAPREAVVAWAFSRTADEMDDSVTEIACVTSKNEVQLGWPYGSVKAQLCARKTKKWGLDVYISTLGDSQIICRSYDECRIPTRFNDGDPVRYRGAESADYSSNITFIADGSAAGFVERLKTADTTKMSLTFYQAGSHVFEFDTKGFQWPVPESAGL